ncbi:MAG: ribonuclease HI [Flavobacteriia bacterium 40-80]|nr:MAG: ribonuclease HI [Flavobacteriia bacterium 40-80]
MENIIEIYTDGSSRGNPGPGGYGTILRFNGKEKELSEGFRLTTNNRMELLAVIKGLEELKTSKFPVKVYSDSKYIVDAINNGWVFGWIKTQFKKKKNPDLWMRWFQVQKQFKVQYIWVKGHNGHPLNERCDQLAVKAALSGDLKIDLYFEEHKNEESELNL